jgi:catechol-2,3-dioxygenase
MTDTASITAITLACADPASLAAFYREVTGWTPIYETEDNVYLGGPDGVRLGFDRVEGYVAPARSTTALPALRIDLATDALQDTVTALLALGAARLGHAYDTDGWVFLADPEGHVFCLTSVY